VAEIHLAPFLRRLKEGYVRGPLYRAAGGPLRDKLVWDFTLGLGFDSFECTRMGARVTAWERSSEVYQKWLELNALALTNEKLRPCFERIRVIFGDAREGWREEKALPDLVVLDPMFPEAKKQSQKRKKAMVLLRELAGDDLDADSLLDAALETNCRRIIVKRPRLAPQLKPKLGLAPSHAVEGKSHRFDVWQPR
jgi:16S rRNA (guanine1516-N2)-methyltransferase